MAVDQGPSEDDGLVSLLADMSERVKARLGVGPLDLATADEARDIELARIRHHERTRTGTLPTHSTDTKASNDMGFADDAAASLQDAFTKIHERGVPQIIAGRNELSEAIGSLAAAGRTYADQWGGYLSNLCQQIEQAAAQANDLSNEIEGEIGRLRQGPR